MKAYFFAICIILTTACTPQRAEPPPPAPVITNTLAATNMPLATATPQPTQTLEPAPIPIHAEQIPLDSCTQIVDARTSSAGIFEVVFEDGEKPSTSTVSAFGSPDGISATDLLLWSEDTHRAVLFPLPPGALGPKISTDHRWILFRYDTTETQSEFWVIGTDGKAGKKLATVKLDQEIKTQYPDGSFSLDYGWVPNTNTFYYKIDVSFGEGVGTTIIDRTFIASKRSTLVALTNKIGADHLQAQELVEKFVLVDANSGKAISLTNPSELGAFEFSPDGSQIVVLTENGLRVLNTQDGRLLFATQTPQYPILYSPDSQYIIHFVHDGILRTDTINGEQQIIPLQYTLMIDYLRPGGDGPGPPPGYSQSPPFKWVGSSTLLAISPVTDKEYVIRSSEKDPNTWMFKVWRVDLADGTAHPGQTFNGDPYSVSFSPDGNRIAFFKIEIKNSPESLHLARLPGTLYLADLNTGEILETIADGQFEAWHPDSSHYIYSTGHARITGEEDHIQYYLGQIGGQSALLDASIPDQLSWLNSEWIVADCQIIHITP